MLCEEVPYRRGDPPKGEIRLTKAINLLASASEQAGNVLTMHTNEALLAKRIAERESITLQPKPVYDVIKRIGDTVCAAAAIVLFSPLIAAAAAAIMIEDPGSPFCTQTRVGKDGREFRMYRFRTTYMDTGIDYAAVRAANLRRGTSIRMKRSPRTTKVGAYLNRSSIDALPQLINVLKGDMSVIGPRPCSPSEQAEKPGERLLVKPGLSCYWQLGGGNSRSKSEQIELDRQYIRERSLRTDLRLIAGTFRFALRRR